MTAILTVGARNLPNKDRFSKSDPFLVIFVVAESGPPRFVKRTETIKVGPNLFNFYPFLTNPEQPEP